MPITKKCSSRLILLDEKKLRKMRGFLTLKIDWKVRFRHFLTTHSKVIQKNENIELIFEQKSTHHTTPLSEKKLEHKDEAIFDIPFMI